MVQNDPLQYKKTVQGNDHNFQSILLRTIMMRTRGRAKPVVRKRQAAFPKSSRSTDLLVVAWIVIAIEVILLVLWWIVAVVLGVSSFSSQQHHKDGAITTCALLSLPIRVYDSLHDIKYCQEPEVPWKQLQDTVPNDKQQQEQQHGLWYMNIPQTDDRVVGSVVLRIAPPTQCTVRVKIQRHQAHQLLNPRRRPRHEHGLSLSNQQQQQQRQQRQDQRILLAFVRDPTSLAILDFFRHQVSERKWDPTDDNFLQYLNSYPGRYHNRYLQHLALDEYNPSNNNNNNNATMEVVTSILHDYDFVGVTERLEESLVVLQLLMGLKLSQIVYLADPGPFQFFVDVCVYTVPPFVSPGMDQFFRSASWQTRIRGDVWLHQAANQSLDATIHSLGPRRVQRQVRLYQQAMDLVQQHCGSLQAFPCTQDGLRIPFRTLDCLVENMGCATSCVDKLAPQIDALA